METQSTPKSARLEARLTTQNHLMIQHAAALRGQSVTEFVVAASMAEAEKSITDHELFKLSVEDSLRFAKALQKPKAPTAAMKKAAKVHRKLVEPS